MPKLKSKKIKKVGVLRGGAGKHYISSLKKGGEIILYISENLGDKYKPIDILVDKNHIWHCAGVPINPGDLATRVDIVWNVAHPSLSNILDSLSIPNIGASSFSFTLENNKEMLRDHIRDIGVEMPRSMILPLYQEDFDGPIEKYPMKKAQEVFEKFSSPWIVKSFGEDKNMGPVRSRPPEYGSATVTLGRPASNGMGIHLAKTFPELVRAIEDGVKHEKSILVEEFIAGKVASVHSMALLRGENVYVFPLGNAFGNLPAQAGFSAEEKEKLSTLAKDLHKHIDAKHYLKSDFILNPRGKVYLLQAESNPNLKAESHFFQACESVLAKSQQIIEHILEQAVDN